MVDAGVRENGEGGGDVEKCVGLEMGGGIYKNVVRCLILERVAEGEVEVEGKYRFWIAGSNKFCPFLQDLFSSRRTSRK